MAAAAAREDALASDEIIYQTTPPVLPPAPAPPRPAPYRPFTTASAASTVAGLHQLLAHSVDDDYDEETRIVAAPCPVLAASISVTGACTNNANKA